MTRPQPDVPGVSHRFVDTARLRMHVAEAGPPDGEPVVLLHGWPQHWYLWRDVIPELAERYRVICPDLRGLGWSDAPPGGYDKESLMEDVVALLDAMGLDRVHLAGHDWGGWIGFLLCLRHPERVTRFMALNIPHPWQSAGARNTFALWRLWYMAVVASPFLGSRVVRSMSRMDDAGARRFGVESWTPEARETFLGQFAEPARANASSQIYRSFLLRDMRRTLSGEYRRLRLPTPTLLLFGTEDFVIPVHQVQGFEPYADDMRLELVPGVGHFIVDEVPELVTRHALEHLGAERATART